MCVVDHDFERRPTMSCGSPFAFLAGARVWSSCAD